MILAQVIGNVVATEKHRDYAGCKILVVQPVDPEGKPKGKSFLAVDGAQAGEGDRVLVLDEGGSAKVILGSDKTVTIRAVVAAIVDRVDREGE
jgi:microcompartment protein CcmK/EutM